MTIKISRKTGWFGSIRSVRIKLNGEEVSRLSNRESTTIKLTGENNSLQVSQSFSNSNIIDVKDGDVIRVKGTLWGDYLFFFLMLANFLLSFFFRPMPQWYLITFLAVMLIELFADLFIPGFHYRLLKE